MTLLDINKDVTFAHVKQYLNVVSKIIKKLFNYGKHKMIRDYQKNFGKPKSTMQHQKFHEKLSEYAVFTIQTGKRCLLCLNEKYEIATYKGVNLLNKKTEIINTC